MTLWPFVPLYFLAVYMLDFSAVACVVVVVNTVSMWVFTSTFSCNSKCSKIGVIRYKLSWPETMTVTQRLAWRHYVDWLSLCTSKVDWLPASLLVFLRLSDSMAKQMASPHPHLLSVHSRLWPTLKTYSFDSRGHEWLHHVEWNL